MAITTQERTNILKLTVGLFNAAPGANYLSEFTSVFEANGHNLGALANTLGTTGAFQSLYPNFQTASEFATKFLTTLGLQGKTEAVDFVTAKFNAGVPKAQIIFDALVALDASTSTEYANAKAILVNKAAVAENYSVTLAASSTSLATLQGAVANVTADAASVTAANAANAGGNGQTFTLTTAIGENVTGTAGSDTFSAVLDGAAGATGTLNTGDAISGGAGTDALNVLVTAASTPAVGNVIKDVEVITFTHVGASGALALSSANYSGVTQLWQADNTNAAGNFQNVVVGADVTAGFKSTGAAATATLLQTAVPANVAVDGTSASQASVAVALDGVLGGAGSGLTFGATTGAFATITVTGSTVAATVAGNTLALVDDTGTKTLNLGLTSATTVNITDVDNSITKVDLSTSTGNVTVGTNLGAGITGVKTVIGGSGNNTFTVDMGTAVAGMSVDLGAGNDTLNLDVTGTTGDTNGTVTLGAGKDTVLTAATISNIVIAGGGVTAATAGELVANIVTIVDFKTSEDVLDLTTGTALTSGQLSTINGSASLLEATQAAAAILNGVAGQVVFSYGGDAYVFNEVAGAAGVNNGDGLIKLVGVDATLFTNIQNGNLVL